MESPRITDEQIESLGILESVLGNYLPILRKFHVKLQQEGEPRGIIGPRDIDIIWERHILNSAAIVPFIKTSTKLSKTKRIADVGSGGGFPGIVAATLLKDYTFVLIEPMERRIEWLSECVELMQLDNVELKRGRSDEVIQEINGLHKALPFDAVTCRAVAPLTKLAGWTLPLLRSQGSLVALKGASVALEIEKAKNQIKQYGGVHPEIFEATVGPHLQSTHVVVVGKK